MRDPHNQLIAARLDEVAALLETQQANRFRVEAYRRAADTLRAEPRPVVEILEAAGPDGLERLPGIGPTIARGIRDLIVTGRLPLLERLRGESDAVTLLSSVPGIGRILAEELHFDHGIDTLEDLEAAAHDGRLDRIPRFGPKRVRGVREALAARLGRLRMRPAATDEPSVGDLLAVDREYREQAAAGRLRTIAPRRFNPSGEAWLPILHTRRGDRSFTALYSNTARAHALGRTRDWVVIYADGGRGERQYTVVTSWRGATAGKRIVRGREAECAIYYGTRVPSTPAVAG
jgi:predicted flap endonuclease-1-like 5' DNA nuclease